MEFILANIPMILCLLAGIALLVVEVYMPGFGVPGVSGVVLLIIGIAMLWINVGALAALGVLVVVIALLAILISVSLKSASSGALSKSPFMLRDAKSIDTDHVTNADMTVFVGLEGVTQTVLRPTGIADVDGVRLNVVSDGEYIAKDARIRVDHIEGSRIVVKRVEEERA